MNLKYPSRKSWLRTLLLIFTRIVVVLLLLRVLKSVPNNSIRTLVNIGGWIGFSLLMGVWSHLYFVFKRRTKFWRVQTKSVVEVVDALKVSFFSDVFAIVSGLILFFTLNYTLKLNEQDAETLLGLLVFLVLIIWFFSMPWFYEKFYEKTVKQK